MKKASPLSENKNNLAPTTPLLEKENSKTFPPSTNMNNSLFQNKTTDEPQQTTNAEVNNSTEEILNSTTNKSSHLEDPNETIIIEQNIDNTLNFNMGNTEETQPSTSSTKFPNLDANLMHSSGSSQSSFTNIPSQQSDEMSNKQLMEFFLDSMKTAVSELTQKFSQAVEQMKTDTEKSIRSELHKDAENLQETLSLSVAKGFDAIKSDIIVSVESSIEANKKSTEKSIESLQSFFKNEISSVKKLLK